MHPSPNWQQKAVDISTLISKIKSGDNVFIHGAAATPLSIIEGLCNRTDLENIRTYHLHLSGCSKLGKESAPHIRPISFFTGADLRSAVNSGHADHIPVFLSDIPHLFTTRQIPLNVAIIHVSPPDQHGICTLGTSIDAARAAVDSAELILAEINEQMPRTHGNTAVPFNKIDFFIATNRPLLEHPPKPASDIEKEIGWLVASLVEDGATLQMGIGTIPDAALSALAHKSDLGVHTEMFSDQLVDLFQSGAITNARKKIHPGRISTSFVNGTRKVYDFVNDNHLVEFHPCDRTNDTALIRKNENVVAINAALQLDLSGQVCADSIGTQIYSGIGGQMDFIRGAALSKNGKPIIALPSTAKNGTLSRIVPSLTEGAGVVTTRGHIHWIVTEYGIVNLHGKSLRERADLLIGISHPDFRSELRKQAFHLHSI